MDKPKTPHELLQQVRQSFQESLEIGDIVDELVILRQKDPKTFWGAFGKIMPKEIDTTMTLDAGENLVDILRGRIETVTTIDAQVIGTNQIETDEDWGL